MKIINIVCLVFILQFSNVIAANEDEYFVSPYLYKFGIERVDDKLVRFTYYLLPPNGPSCLTVEMLEPISSVIEDKLEICELHVKDKFTDEVMSFQDEDVLSGAYIENIELKVDEAGLEAELMFTAELDIAGQGAYTRTLECIVPIKNKKIQAVACVTVGNQHGRY